MNSIERIFAIVISVFLLSGIKSFADTFVVTNLNDPGDGSLRQAIDDSNSNEGPDTIVFEEGLQGTISMNLGEYFISDNVGIVGPGPDKITIDAQGKSSIFIVADGNDEINRIVEISGLRLINGTLVTSGGILKNHENLIVENCEFINGESTLNQGGAIANSNILTIKSSLFENNRAIFGGTEGLGGAIVNNGILVISDSVFSNNQASFGGAIINGGIIELISNTLFSNNSAVHDGGAINTSSGVIEKILNTTFYNNSAILGGAIADLSNDAVVYISFTTFANNEASSGGANWATSPTKIRNSIFALNTPDNCIGTISDFGGNYSDDFSCGLAGDDSLILLGPLADNGGPTETMTLIGGDPVDGATVNCDALNEMGNPTGIPVGVDQRYFPRPSGPRCDSGAFESQPTATITVAKVTDPSGVEHFRFGSNGFDPLQDCPLDGGGDGIFILNDGDSISCIVPQGNYSIKENIPQGYNLSILCFEAPDNLVINNQTGEIEFTVDDSGSDVDCLYTNVRKGGGGGGCTLAPAGASSSIPLYLLIPVLIFIRRIIKRNRV